MGLSVAAAAFVKKAAIYGLVCSPIVTAEYVAHDHIRHGLHRMKQIAQGHRKQPRHHKVAKAAPRVIPDCPPSVPIGAAFPTAPLTVPMVNPLVSTNIPLLSPPLEGSYPQVTFNPPIGGGGGIIIGGGGQPPIQPPPAIPEPPTWMALIVGMVGVGVMARKAKEDDLARHAA